MTNQQAQKKLSDWLGGRTGNDWLGNVAKAVTRKAVREQWRVDSLLGKAQAHQEDWKELSFLVQSDMTVFLLEKADSFLPVLLDGKMGTGFWVTCYKNHLSDRQRNADANLFAHVRRCFTRTLRKDPKFSLFSVRNGKDMAFGVWDDLHAQLLLSHEDLRDVPFPHHRMRKFRGVMTTAENMQVLADCFWDFQAKRAQEAGCGKFSVLVSDVMAWLFRSVTPEMLGFWECDSGDMDENLEDPAFRPDTQVENAAMNTAVAEWVGSLDPDRKTLLADAAQGVPLKDTAAKLGLSSPSAVLYRRNGLFRDFKELTDALGPLDSESCGSMEQMMTLCLMAALDGPGQGKK